MNHAYEIIVSLHANGPLSVDAMLRQLRRYTRRLATLSPRLEPWLLGAETKTDALRYPVYDEDEPSATAMAVLEAKLQGRADPRMISLWNGLDDDAGASLSFMGRPAPHLSLVTFNGYPESFSSDWRAVAGVLAAGAEIWSPHYISVESDGYYDHKTFKDRPGVGWMLYLPGVLTTRQVPEARALVPVPGPGQQQVGTIVVSVTDAPFSDADPEHVKVANAIEVRLVDQDLLPRYKEL